MKRTFARAGVMLALVLGCAGTAHAQVVHSLNVGAGFSWPRALDSRVAGDVLVANLNQPLIPGLEPPATGSLLFEFSDFRGYPVFGEWQISFGKHFELGVGASYSNRQVNSVYRDLLNGQGTPENPNDDTEIPQTLRLRQIPITGVVRIVFGRPDRTQLYFGGGVSAVYFTYTESGQFVQLSDLSVFTEKYEATDIAIGGVALGGLRFALGGDVYALTVEGKYQWASGKTGGAPAGFLGDKIDLSGGSVLFGLLIRY